MHSPNVPRWAGASRLCYAAPRRDDLLLVRSEVATVAANGFEVRRLSGAIGAEILGIDLAAEPGHNVIAAIRKVWLDHGVIFLRDQDLLPAKFLSFAKRFGEIVEYPFIKGIEGFPEIIPVVKREHEKHNFGGMWHTDTAYLDTPPMGTMLIAREVPPYGGDALFANAYLAYETLSKGMKRMLDDMVAINSSAKVDVSRTREERA
jgi:taurine dioxygenase